MSFLVNFRSAEGKPGYHPTESLEEAIRFVEHLRNQEHVVDARVWRLHEVPLEVKTYYKVEVVAAEPAVPKPAAPKPPAAPRVEDDSKAEPVTAGAASDPGAGGIGPNGARFGRFNRT